MRLPILLLCLVTFATYADDQPWLTYRVYPGELAIRDPNPRVSVWADGRVEVYRAAWQPNAGRYRYQLSAGALDELVAQATDAATVGIDLAAAEFAIETTESRLRHEERRVYALEDGDSYHIEIAAGAAPASRTPAAGDVTLVWQMVHPELERAAAVPARTRLAELRKRLEALAVIDDAARIGEAQPLQRPGQ